METPDVAVQIRSIRVQLDVLEARLQLNPRMAAHTLADLRGVLSDVAQSTEQEIDAVAYRGIAEEFA